MTEKELHNLALKYFQGNSTHEEEALLHQWYDKAMDNDQVVINSETEGIDEVKARLFLQLQSKIKEGHNPKKLNSAFNKKWLSYAASVFFVLSTSLALWYFNSKQASKEQDTKLLAQDIRPGGSSAVLELSDGSTINLDEATVGSLVNVDGLNISKLSNGILSVEVSRKENNGVAEVHTIRTPQGGQYQIKLPDGSDVWLNSSSSIKFPSIFSTVSREVELEGEAYFEIAKLLNNKDKQIPFFVKSKEQLIEVLGTHFNVSSYTDEVRTRTTLLEGSVKIHLTNGSKAIQQLFPGEESNVSHGVIQVQSADLEAAMAWKNGDFIFNNESLEDIMRKISRWYDVEIVYQNAHTTLKFSGAVSRAKNLSEVLNIMKLTGKVSFKIEGRRVLVMT